jgi:TolB-like protein/Flp pilus assembly protein TadD
MDGKATAFGPFVLDRERRRLTRNGEPIAVNQRGYSLLETLLEFEGEPVSKDILMERAWGSGTAIEESNLSVQISTLRKQLGDRAEAMIVTVPRVGYRLVASEGWTGPDGGPPRVAVLPFANRGNVAEDGYFADGVVDDIITALSRFRQFAVLSRGSSFALAGKGGDARTAAAELGVRYALEGSIRRMGDRLRITAQLVDAKGGTELWAERYDGDLADIFTFQDRITESVVGVIEPAIRKAEIARARRKPTASLDAYDLVLKALPLVLGPDMAGHKKALPLLMAAMDLDHGYALPRACAAWIYEQAISMRAAPHSSDDAANSIALAREALALDGNDPLIRGICGYVLYRVADDTSAREGLFRAVEENPNNVTILALAATSNRRSGNIDEAFRCYARAYELSPGAPEAYRALHGMGAAEMIRGNYEAAIGWCEKALATFNDWLYSYITLATCYANLGRMDEAAAMVRRIRELSPSLTVQRIVNGADPKDRYAMTVIPGLRKAGLPEG